jgi:hypothetical protein
MIYYICIYTYIYICSYIYHLGAYLGADNGSKIRSENVLLKSC